MTEDRDWLDEVAFPVLLRAAGTAYGSAIRRAVADGGATTCRAAAAS